MVSVLQASRPKKAATMVSRCLVCSRTHQYDCPISVIYSRSNKTSTPTPPSVLWRRDVFIWWFLVNWNILEPVWCAGRWSEKTLDDIVRHPTCRCLIGTSQAAMGPLTTLMYDAITSLIKASSGNKVPAEGESGRLYKEGRKGDAASTVGWPDVIIAL